MRKVALWVFFLALAFLGGSVIASMTLYHLTLKNQPPIVIQGGAEVKKRPSKGHVCSFAIVEWQDAAIWAKAAHDFNPDADWHQYLGHNVSIGCVEEKDGVLLVVHGFSDKKPDDFLILPAAWVYKIIWLAPVGGPK